MQSDAFPTPQVYSLQLQPRLLPDYAEKPDPARQDDLEHSHDYQQLIQKMEMLISDCSTAEYRSFWVATDHIKIKHRLIESMQKIESIFLDLVRDSTQNPELIAAVSESLFYSNEGSQNCGRIPDFLKPRLIPNQEIAQPFLDSKTNTGFGLQLTKG